MTIRPPSFLRACAALALCAVSMAATAQSAEYRRGYDDGFRAGQQSQQGGYPQGGFPPGGFGQGGYGQGGYDRGRGIEILEARYGRGNRACDARGTVQNIVDQRGDAVFEVSNDLCGDPAPNQPKALEVTYRCGRGGGPQRVSANETQGIRIACR